MRPQNGKSEKKAFQSMTMDDRLGEKSLRKKSLLLFLFLFFSPLFA